LIAERFREKFPDLLPEFYNPDDFKFRATKTERAVQSAFYFATGLFDRKGKKI
jgi:multiple inositol-polyphosphate phosphatase/2,3-bisphosphoglycerate 3-phosphatase